MSKGKVLKGCDPVVYDMPHLKGVLRPLPLHGDTASAPRRSADEIEREAYESGYAAGERSGLEMGERKAQLLLDRLAALFDEVSSLKGEIIRELEPQLLETAGEIARKILRTELSLKPELLLDIVREALRKMELVGTIRIRLTPALHEHLGRLRPALLEIHPDIVFEVDPSAPAGGPVVIGEREVVMTDIDSQLAHLIGDVKDSSGKL